MISRKSLVFFLFLALVPASLPAQDSAQTAPAVFGYRNFAAEAKIEEKFLAIPNAFLAGEALKTLTAEPHLASTPGDRKTAEYVAAKFRAAGLETEIIPYRVLMNQPKAVRLEAWDPSG